MQIIYTELKNTLEYFCSINVFDTQMLMRVSYNSRSKKRLISLTSLDESILFLKPTYITEGSRVFPNVNAKLNGLSFYITLNPLSFSGENYKDWANQYQLCFVEYTPYTNLTTERFYVNNGEGYYDGDTSVTPSYSDWVVTNVEIVNQDIKYFGEKTNTIDTYDSYSSYPLEQALINSFSDVDMQQWQAFKDAVNELTGVTEWFVDIINQQVYYTDGGNDCKNFGYTWTSGAKIYTCPIDVFYDQNICLTNTNAKNCRVNELWADPWYTIKVSDVPENSPPTKIYLEIGFEYYGTTTSNYLNVSKFEKLPEIEDQTIYIQFSEVAQKIISNTSSTNEGLSLIAEAYIDEVANSINNTDENKQFVKLEDLKTQLEQNKTLRS